MSVCTSRESNSDHRWHADGQPRSGKFISVAQVACPAGFKLHTVVAKVEIPVFSQGIFRTNRASI